MISVTARLFFCLWVSSLERHSEALLQPDTWARIKGCFLGKYQHVVEFSDAFFGQIDSIRFIDCFIDEGKRRGKTFNSIISSSGSEGRANALGWRERSTAQHQINRLSIPRNNHLSYTAGCKCYLQVESQSRSGKLGALRVQS